LIKSGIYCKVAATLTILCLLSKSIICSITGLFAIGTIGLGLPHVRGLSLVPSPPAIITAFIFFIPSLSFNAERPALLNYFLPIQQKKYRRLNNGYEFILSFLMVFLFYRRYIYQLVQT